MLRALRGAVAVMAFLALSATPALAVTALWLDPEMILQADRAIIPADMTGGSPDAFEPDDLEHAQPLRIGDTPVDRVVVSGDDDYFELLSDGPGYVRIGVTGAVSISDGCRDSATNGSLWVLDGRMKGADLQEVAKPFPNRPAGLRFFTRIATKSKRPVAYRISLVRELPENRVGSTEPGVVAEQYLFAVARGDSYALYESTRSQYTTEQVDVLRERLFGTRQLLEGGFGVRTEPGKDPDVAGARPVQHIILWDGGSPDPSRQWAFVVRCEKRDGFWIVADASRDPELTDEEVAALVRRDLDGMGQPLGSGSHPSTPAVVASAAVAQDSTHRARFWPPSTTVLVGSLAVAAAGALGLARLGRKKP